MNPFQQRELDNTWGPCTEHVPCPQLTFPRWWLALPPYQCRWQWTYQSPPLYGWSVLFSPSPVTNNSNLKFYFSHLFPWNGILRSMVHTQWSLFPPFRNDGSWVRSRVCTIGFNLPTIHFEEIPIFGYLGGLSLLGGTSEHVPWLPTPVDQTSTSQVSAWQFRSMVLTAFSFSVSHSNLYYGSTVLTCFLSHRTTRKILRRFPKGTCK